MSATLRNDILSHVHQYLAGWESAYQLEDWLLEASWNVHKHPDSVAKKLAGKVGLYLAEYDKGHRTEAELQRLLQQVVYETAPLPTGTTG